jgi:hypothetical protein
MNPVSRALAFCFGGAVVGAFGAVLLGLLFGSRYVQTLPMELAVYAAVGAVSGFFLGIGLAILSLLRPKRDSEWPELQGLNEDHEYVEGESRGIYPVLRFIIIIGTLIFIVRLLMITATGW